MKHRPIKFRAWHTDEYPNPERRETMLQHDQLSVDACLENVGYGNMILMQFTGLFDKHGTEIYEGDILQSTYVDSFDNQMHEILNEVLFETGSFGIIGEITGEFVTFDESYIFDQDRKCDAEVVANTCTHELIEQVLYSRSDLEPVTATIKCLPCKQYNRLHPYENRNHLSRRSTGQQRKRRVA